MPGPEPDLHDAPPGRRLRVAVLTRVFAPWGGGAERYAMALVEQLAARHDIHVFAQTVQHQWPGVHYHRIARPFARPRWLNQLWFAGATWWATRRGFDLVHSHEATWHGQLQTVHVLPVRHTLLRGLQGWRLAWRWLRILSSPRLLTYCALERARLDLRAGQRAVVAISQPLAQQLEQAYPFLRGHLHGLPPGVVWPQAVAGGAAAARQQLGLPAEGFGLLFVANDFRRKGLPTLLQALAGLPDTVWLAVVGQGGRQLGAFRHQIETLGLAHRVHFLGPLGDVSPAYRAADALAHPTWEDSFAMVVLEAMAHGLPVAVSGPDHCGIATLLETERHALLLNDPGDVAGWTMALKRLVSDAGLRQRLGQAAMALARDHQWPALARQQETLWLRYASGASEGADPSRNPLR